MPVLTPLAPVALSFTFQWCGAALPLPPPPPSSAAALDGRCCPAPPAPIMDVNGVCTLGGVLLRLGKAGPTLVSVRSLIDSRVCTQAPMLCRRLMVPGVPDALLPAAAAAAVPSGGCRQGPSMLLIAAAMAVKETPASSATAATAPRKCLKGKRRLPGGLQRVKMMSMAH